MDSKPQIYADKNKAIAPPKLSSTTPVDSVHSVHSHPLTLPPPQDLASPLVDAAPRLSAIRTTPSAFILPRRMFPRKLSGFGAAVCLSFLRVNSCPFAVCQSFVSIRGRYLLRANATSPSPTRTPRPRPRETRKRTPANYLGSGISAYRGHRLDYIEH